MSEPSSFDPVAYIRALRRAGMYVEPFHEKRTFFVGNSRGMGEAYSRVCRRFRTTVGVTLCSGSLPCERYPARGIPLQFGRHRSGTAGERGQSNFTLLGTRRNAFLRTQP